VAIAGAGKTRADYPYLANCTTPEQRLSWDQYIDSWLAVGAMLGLVEDIFTD
jgi:hypothetical protein